MDAPVICIGAFPILTARSGRRSIYNITTTYSCVLNKGISLNVMLSVLWDVKGTITTDSLEKGATKQKIARTKDYGRGLRWWHSTSGKYTLSGWSLLHSLELAAGGIGLHVNTDKTEFMCLNQRGDISTRNGRSLKLVDKLTYLRSSV